MSSAVIAARRGTKRSGIQRGARPFALGLVAPTVLVMAVIVGFPVYYAIRLSLHRQAYLSPEVEFVGLDNYRRIVGDPSFWTSAWQGTIYTISSVAIQLVLGTAIALVLHWPFRGRGLARGLALLPYVVPTVAAVAVWKWALNDTFGVVNRLLIAIGVVDAPIAWLAPRSIMFVLIAMSVWAYTPFVVVVVLARLQTMPTEMFEAARIDGAGSARIFRYITFPQLLEVFGAVVLLRLYWMFTKFDLIWLVGEGGAAGRAIENVPVYGYRATFQELNTGEGAAAAVLLMVVLVVFSLVYLRAVPIERGSAE